MPRALDEAIKASAAGDETMHSIFADTAMTTLQEQLNAEQRKTMPLGAVERVVDNSTPQELFGDDNGLWAQLAFVGEKKTPNATNK